MSQWSYSINPFLSSGLRNYKRGFELSNYTDEFLQQRQADAFFGPIYIVFHPVHDALRIKYVAWTGQHGEQESATETLEELIYQLGFGKKELNVTSLINDWDLAVQSTGPTFRKGTANYKLLFPDGHKPFQTGEIDMRINTVEALSLELGNFVPLAAVKVTVDAFLTNLNNARAAEVGEITETNTDSDEVKAVLIPAMIGLFTIYGQCVVQFAATPLAIEPVFNLELLRHLPQMQWVESIESSTTENIFKRTLQSTRKIEVTVLTNFNLQGFFSKQKKATTGVHPVTFPANQTNVYEISSMMDDDLSTYFNVINPEPAEEGHIKIRILPQGS